MRGVKDRRRSPNDSRSLLKTESNTRLISLWSAERGLRSSLRTGTCFPSQRRGMISRRSILYLLFQIVRTNKNSICDSDPSIVDATAYGVVAESLSERCLFSGVLSTIFPEYR